MANTTKHGKKGKGRRQNRKIIVKEILIRFKDESGVRLLPFLVILADWLQDGQIDGFGVLPDIYARLIT